MEPQTVSVVVYGAKGLKPKKKNKHKFSVKFGVGQNKYVTETVEDLFNNPSWNTESEIPVADPSAPLRLVVLQKDDVLGQVQVPLGDLPTFQRFRQVRAPLQPHRKCPHPEGELVYEAWVSAHHPAPDSVSLQSNGSGAKSRHSISLGLRKLKGKLSHSPIMPRRSEGGGAVAFGLAHRGAVSCHDLSGFHGNMLSVASDSLTSLDSDTGADSAARRKSASVLDLGGAKGEADEGMGPEINGVSPRESPVEGGTRVTIRGENLGLRKEDVVGLYICGSNCLASLEYVSSHKLICTTKPWKACTGNIVIETQSGGKAISLVEFVFVPTRHPSLSEEPSPSPSQATPLSDSASPKAPAPLSASPQVTAPIAAPAAPMMATPLSASPGMATPLSASPSPSAKSTHSEHEEAPAPPMGQPPAKPPRKLKAPIPDSPEELRRRSDPFALSPSPSNSFRQRGSPAAEHKAVPTTHVMPPTPDQPPEEVLSEETKGSDRPVAEIKPQPTARKRHAPPPPRHPSPTPSNEADADVISPGKAGHSRFYDISFVENEDDSAPPSPKTQPTTFFDKDAAGRKSPEPQKPPEAPPASKLPAGPSQSEFDDLKSRHRALELDAQKKQSEIKRWTDGYKQLQHENRNLRDENASMKAYIERLVAQVMVRCPEALDHDCLH